MSFQVKAPVVVATLGAIVIALLMLRGGAGSSAMGRTPSDRAAALSAQLMSPYCQGMTLATCPSSAAGELRREIATRFAAGESEDQIRESLIYRFGETLRASPEPRGVGLALWAVPAVLGAGMLAWLVVSSGLARSRREAEPWSADPIDTALASRLEDELQQLG